MSNGRVFRVARLVFESVAFFFLLISSTLSAQTRCAADGSARETVRAGDVILCSTWPEEGPREFRFSIDEPNERWVVQVITVSRTEDDEKDKRILCVEVWSGEQGVDAVIAAPGCQAREPDSRVDANLSKVGVSHSILVYPMADDKPITYALSVERLFPGPATTLAVGAYDDEIEVPGDTDVFALQLESATEFQVMVSQLVNEEERDARSSSEDRVPCLEIWGKGQIRQTCDSADGRRAVLEVSTDQEVSILLSPA